MRFASTEEDLVLVVAEVTGERESQRHSKQDAQLGGSDQRGCGLS
ncbi:hypothetical protein AB0F09_05515 [Streptomyces olivaceus]